MTENGIKPISGILKSMYTHTLSFASKDICLIVNGKPQTATKLIYDSITA